MGTDAPRNLFFYELCRLCLENAGARDVCESSDLIDDIFACTGVKVKTSDNLPHKICTKCAEVVKSSKELRILARKNDNHLQTLFGDAQNDSENESVDIGLNQSIHTTGVTDSRQAELTSPVNSNVNSQSSSKQKLCMLLQEGEKTNEVGPVIRQTISLRKDLFPPSAQTTSPAKAESSPKKIAYHKLLKVKVEEENRCKRMKTDDDDEDITYYCKECDKGFDKYKKLYLHQRLHNKKICCPLDACGKKFATKGDMEKHIRTHTGERPFQCTQCDKSFSQRVSLRQHVSTVHATEEDS